MVAVDELAGVVAFLRADADVAALCGTRVWGTEMPDTEAAALQAAINAGTQHGCIVVNDTGLGSGGGALGMANASYIPVSATTKDLRAYDSTPYRAKAVYMAAFNALKNMRRLTRAGALLYSAVPTAAAQMREPAVDWPVAFGTFNLLAAEVA